MGINEIGKNREETFKIGKEWRIIKGPRAGFVEVPLRKRERVCESKPVAMHLKVCAVIGWNQKKLYAGSYGKEPPKL